MKLSIIALTIILTGCTASNATFETGKDTYYKPVNKAPETVVTPPEIAKPPAVIPRPKPCIKHKDKCKNPNFKKGHKKHKKHKKSKKSKRH